MLRIAAIMRCAMVGSLTGGAFGIGLGYLLAPVREPGQPLRHEWYMMAVVAYVFWSAIGGMILGLILGAFPNRKVAWLAFSGLMIGSIAGYVTWNTGPSPPDHSYTGITIVGITFGG